MFPQRRMTTDTPDGNYSQALNLFVRGEDGWVQMPSRSISLNDYMKQLIKAHNADIDTEGTPEEFDKALGELYDLTEWEDAEAAIRELHARGPEIERLYLDSKILPGELRALVMVSNCLEREFIHRQLATGQPLHMNVL